MDGGDGGEVKVLAQRIGSAAAALDDVNMMTPLLERRSAAFALHSSGLTIVTQALRDLQRAADSPDPVFWLESALERVRTAARVVERLGEMAELLRSR